MPGPIETNRGTHMVGLLVFRMQAPALLDNCPIRIAARHVLATCGGGARLELLAHTNLAHPEAQHELYRYRRTECRIYTDVKTRPDFNVIASPYAPFLLTSATTSSSTDFSS